MLRMRKREKQKGNGGDHSSEIRNRPLSNNIEENLKYLREIFNNCSDVVFREFLLAQREQIKLAMIYIDGLTDKTRVSEEIMKALALEVPMATSNTEITKANALHYIKMRGLCINKIKETGNFSDVINAVLSGNTVLLVDGNNTAIINETQGWEKRSIEESKTEIIVRGPRESFVETLSTNTSMLRRKIKNPDLKIETMELGEKTNTQVALVYVAGIVNEGLVEEARKRLSRIKIDGILESGYIEEFISDTPYTVFPTIAHTDRPDRVAAYLLEGRVAIMVEGTPVVLTAPSIFMESIQTPEDYYERAVFMSAIRGLRILTMILAMTLPSLYVAIISFHHEMLPTPLLLSIASQREAVPLPVFVEVLFMEIAFEIIREAGIRLPRPVGQAVSIVAALIIGEAAVTAGMVAGTTIIVVPMTAIASFTVYYSGSIAFRTLRFPLVFLAASLGLFGLITGLIIIVVHMASLRSFGIPYLEPIAPIVPGDLKDSALRAPWWAIKRGPNLMGQNNPRRAVPGMKPKPPTVNKRE